MTDSATRSSKGATPSPILGICLVLFSALLIATVPNAAKIAYQHGADPLAVITVRTIIGALGLALYLTITSQWPGRAWKSFRLSSLSGLSLLLTSVGFMGSVAFIDVSLAAMIFYLHPFLVALAGHFRGELRLQTGHYAMICLAIGGLVLVLGVTLETLNSIGIGLSLLGMASAAALILLVAGQAREIGPIAANYYMSLWAAIYLLIAATIGPATGLIGAMTLPLTPTGWLAIVLAGATLTLGFVTFFVGLRIIGTTRAVMLSLAEPVFAILLAIALVGEWLSLVQWIGVGLIVGSLYRFEAISSSAESAG